MSQEKLPGTSQPQVSGIAPWIYQLVIISVASIALIFIGTLWLFVTGLRGEEFSFRDPAQLITGISVVFMLIVALVGIYYSKEASQKPRSAVSVDLMPEEEAKSLDLMTEEEAESLRAYAKEKQQVANEKAYVAAHPPIPPSASNPVITMQPPIDVLVLGVPAKATAMQEQADGKISYLVELKNQKPTWVHDAEISTKK